MKIVSFKKLQKSNNQKPSFLSDDILDNMAIKWARKAEYYRKRKYKQLAMN